MGFNQEKGEHSSSTEEMGERRDDAKGNDGGKRSSLLPSRENGERNDTPMDHFRQLPVEILSNILSRLTMKEAARTSVLSAKWRHLWTSFAGMMDFDASLLMCQLQLGLGNKSLDVERQRFVSWVNRVQRSLESSTLEGLRISFDLDSDSKLDIDNWIAFAMQKRVELLDLDLTSIDQSIKTTGLYTFSSNLLNRLNFSSLKTLRLNMVDVSGEILEHLVLYCCPLLEALCLADLTSLASLKVSGPSLKLKYLEIVCCNSLKDLEISLPILMYFKYYGPRIGISFKNVPNLVKASFGGPFCPFLLDNLYLFLKFVWRLEILKLNVGSAYLSREFYLNFPVFVFVKHLEVTTAVSAAAHCLLPCIKLLKAFPSLRRFTLKISYESSLLGEAFHKVSEDYTHSSLEVVEVLGFQGNAAEIELVLNLVSCAALLKKLIINPCAPCYIGTSSQLQFQGTEMYISARQHAVELAAKLSVGVEFVVL